MDLKFPCPTCGTELTVDETAAGKTFACPACQGSVVVPASQPTRTSGPPPSSTAGRSSAAPPPPSSAGRSSAAPPPPSSSGKPAAPPPPSGGGGSAPPPPSGSTLSPPSAEGEALAPEDAVMDEPEHGSYSAGFLAQTIDNKMAQLRGTTNSFFLGISSPAYPIRATRRWRAACRSCRSGRACGYLYTRKNILIPELVYGIHMHSFSAPHRFSKILAQPSRSGRI